MNENLEIESKSLINKEDYERILPLFSSTQYEQINYYIDTKEQLLIRNKISLRLRNKNNSFELTIKIPQKEGKKEINLPVSLEEGEEIIKTSKVRNATINALLKHYIEDNELIVIGSLKTLRVDMNYSNGLLSLDKNEYNGLVDYEIEYEGKTKKEADNMLLTFLENNNIKAALSNVTKMKRCLSSKEILLK